MNNKNVARPQSVDDAPGAADVQRGAGGRVPAPQAAVQRGRRARLRQHVPAARHAGRRHRAYTVTFPAPLSPVHLLTLVPS